MTFEEVLDQAMAMLQRQFQLDDDTLSDLTDALLFAHPQVRDEAGHGLVWSGVPATAPAVDTSPANPQDREPLSYTPVHLTEKILTSRAALAGERKQVTVLFADLKDSMARVHEALALAHTLSHPFSLALARCVAAFVAQFRRDVPAVHEQAEACVALATEQGCPLWAAYGTSVRGWALAMQSQRKEGMAGVHTTPLIRLAQ